MTRVFCAISWHMPNGPMPFSSRPGAILPARDLEEMRRRVGHIVGVQHGFLSILRGENPGIPPTGAPPSFDRYQEPRRDHPRRTSRIRGGLESR